MNNAFALILVSTATLSLASFASAAPSEAAHAYSSANQRATAEYKMTRPKCDSLSGNPKDLCIAEAKATRIRAEAERQRVEIIANAASDAEKIRGEGDAKATSIYAQAFGHNPEFYSFYRSMEAYRQTFKNKSDVMVVDPSSEFFKYLKGSGKSGK